MSKTFPFQAVPSEDVQKMTYNSLIYCPCLQSSTEIPTDNIEEYRNTTDLYNAETIFTHAPDPHNNIDQSLDINARCNYYTNHDFHRLKHKSDSKKPFSILHTNIESLMHNFDSLERLCTDLEYDFDIIALSETWNSESQKAKFIHLVFFW